MGTRMRLLTILTVFGGAFTIAGVGATPGNAAEQQADNCWEGTDPAGSIVHSFESELNHNRTCDADGKHDEKKPDLCEQHHFHCS